MCDAFSAMTTDRPYRPAMPLDAALEELHDSAGTQFDPQGRERSRARPYVIATRRSPRSSAIRPRSIDLEVASPGHGEIIRAVQEHVERATVDELEVGEHRTA